MARRLVKHVKLAAAVALLLDGSEEVTRRTSERHHASATPRYVNERALTDAQNRREEMLARTTDALNLAKAAAGTQTERERRKRG